MNKTTKTEVASQSHLDSEAKYHRNALANTMKLNGFSVEPEDRFGTLLSRLSAYLKEQRNRARQ